MKLRLGIVALVALAAVALPATAAALPSLLWQVPEDGVAGEGAGRLGVAFAKIATDAATGHVFVADAGNNRIDEFTSWGEFVKAFGWKVNASDPEERLQTCTAATGCQAGSGGPGAGQFGGGFGVATGANGDVYVLELQRAGGGILEPRVQAIDPTAGTGGDEAAFLWMAGGSVNKTKAEEAGSSEAERNLCTAGTGDVCQAGTSGIGEGQFNFGTEHGSLANIAVGADGSVYVADKGADGGEHARIQVFNSSGEFQRQLGVPPGGAAGTFGGKEEPGALAIDPSSGDLYLAYTQSADAEARGKQPDVYRLDSTGTLIEKLPVEAPGAIAVDSAGRVYVVNLLNENKTVTEVLEFDSTGIPLIAAGSGFATQAKNTSLIGLATNVLGPGSSSPGDLYVTALNGSANPAEARSFVLAYGPPEEFEEPPREPPSIVSQYALSVSRDSAQIEAKVNPRFWKTTTVYVEYGTGRCSEGGCPSVAPAPPGSSLTSQAVGAPVLSPPLPLTGLVPATTYHYRVVASTEFAPGEVATVRGVGGEVGSDGTEGTFSTALPSAAAETGCPNQAFRIGFGALLPDCRAYEMVSPIEKNGGDIVALLSTANFAARLVQSAASGNALTFSSYASFAGSQSAQWSSQYLAERTSSGWSTKGISPPKSGIGTGPEEFDTLYRAFSTDLSSGWLIYQGTDPLDPAVPGGFTTLYRRDNAAGRFEGQIGVLPPSESRDNIIPELQGVSADGTHAVFRVRTLATERSTKLIGEAAETDEPQLYEAFGEPGEPRRLRLVSVLPTQAPATAGASAGTSWETAGSGRLDSVAHAISEDGSRIYWSAAKGRAGKLYVRVNGNRTFPVSETVSTGDAVFWTASADGSKALYSFTSGAKEGDLYEYDLGSKASTLVAENFQGLMGAAEDLSSFYFVSAAALAGGAVAGEPNIYVDREGSLAFVAPLSNADVPPSLASRGVSPVATSPYFHAARVSPNGKTLVFMSTSRALSEATAGYDNTDRESGAADGEVYRYDADGGELSCVSCAPTGIAPLGRLRQFGGTAPAVWVGAEVPGSSMQLHQPRYLSDDGTRVFFNSFTPLIAGDTNEAADVYEWEAPGAGAGPARCTDASPAFSARNRGCLYLISSGKDARDSEFIDADPTGANVFFATLQSLLPQDPGQVDIYDARVDGGFPQPPALTPCEGEDCQSPASAPSAVSPATGQSGPGNLKPVCPKGMHKAKKHGKKATKSGKKAMKSGKHGKARCVKNKKRRNKTNRHSHHHQKQPHKNGRA